MNKQGPQFFCNLFAGKGTGTNMPLGNDHIIHPWRDAVLTKAEIFPHNPFDTVTPHGIAHLFAHGKAKSPRPLIVAVKDEEDEMQRKIPTAPIIACFKLGPPDKMTGFGKG